MIVHFIFGLFVAVIIALFIMFVLGFVDILNDLIRDKETHFAEKFGEAIEVVTGLIGMAFAAVGIPVFILCVLFLVVMAIIG